MFVPWESDVMVTPRYFAESTCRSLWPCKTYSYLVLDCTFWRWLVLGTCLDGTPYATSVPIHQASWDHSANYVHLHQWLWLDRQWCRLQKAWLWHSDCFWTTLWSIVKHTHNYCLSYLSYCAGCVSVFVSKLLKGCLNSCCKGNGTVLQENSESSECFRLFTFVCSWSSKLHRDSIAQSVATVIYSNL